MNTQIIFSSGSPKSNLQYWVGVASMALLLGYLLLFQIFFLIAFVMSSFVKSALLSALAFPAVIAGVYGIFLIFREVVQSKSIPGFTIAVNEIELRLLNRKKRKFQIRDIKEVSCSKIPFARDQCGWFLFITNSGKKYLVFSKDFDRAHGVLLSLDVSVRQTRWIASALSLLVVTYISAFFFPTLIDAIGIFFLMALIYALVSRKGLHFHVITKEMEAAILCLFVSGILMGILSTHLDARGRQRLAKHPEISRDVANSKRK
jgi:hypothetical protein